MATTKERARKGSWSDDTERGELDNGHLAAMESAEPTQKAVAIVLPKLDIRTIDVRLIGDSELVCHHWSEKTRKEMLDKQMGEATAGKEKKDPVRDYHESAYVLKPAPKGKPFEDSEFGFPAIAFKNAAVTACTSLGRAVSKVAARQAFHVIGEMVRIDGRPHMREDMVRVGMSKVADIRFRAGFTEWACTLRLRYNARVLTDQQIVNLLNTAGFAVGVGEWRPEKNGAFGMFHVATV